MTALSAITGHTKDEVFTLNAICMSSRLVDVVDLDMHLFTSRSPVQRPNPRSHIVLVQTYL